MSQLNSFFKIVYIKSLSEMEPIPGSWEEGGLCWFPSQTKEIKQFQCMKEKLPDKVNWPQYKCEVKASNISSWQLANSIANNLCNEPSSSASEEDQEEVCLPKRVVKSTVNTSDFDYSHLFASKNKKQKVGDQPRDQLKKSQQKSRKTDEVNSEVNDFEMSNFEVEGHPNSTSHSETLQVMNNLDNNFGDVTLTNDSLVLASSTDIKEVMEAIKEYKSKLDDVKEEIITELKHYINERFCSLSVELSYLSKDIKNVQNEPLDMTMGGLNPFPLTSTEEVESFEEKCSSEEYFKKTVVHLRKIIGTGQPWRTTCYKLSSIMFTKELLTHYSWTGVSRSSIQKVAFNKLHNILSIFYHVIKICDASFSFVHREVFFRDAILKHSSSRVKKKCNKENTTPEPEPQPIEEIVLQEPLFINMFPELEEEIEIAADHVPEEN